MTNINIKKRLELAVSLMQEALKENIPLTFAENYANLQFAEQHGYIVDDWKKRVDLNSGNEMLIKEKDLLIGEWLERYRMLKQITEYPGGFSWEEIMQIMGLRSTLENTWNFIPTKDKKILSEQYGVDFNEMDMLVSAALQKEKDHSNSCRTMRTLGLDTLNPAHWWWHRNNPEKG